MTNENLRDLDRSLYDAPDDSSYINDFTKGSLNQDLIYDISRTKEEPEWMLQKRLKSLQIFNSMPMPTWGPDLSKLDFDNITYFAKATDVPQSTSWEDVPENIKNTFERLGIPEAERSALAGAGAQYESTMVYHNLKDEWKAKGVIFEDFDVAVKEYPDLVQQHFMKCVPANDHKFSALHGAVFSGGTLLYIPTGVCLDLPVQAYFRMNAPNMGQFEHTLIIVEEGASVQYIEGCSAPKYDKRSLHAGCVEIFVKKSAKAGYSSVESWSIDTYNLNTKRAIVDDYGHIEWIGGNLGSGITMLYPCSILRGEGSIADHLGVAFANKGQIQDTGAKVIHVGSHSKSTIVMKSISKGGGTAVYRGLLKVLPQAHGCTSMIECDALILDDQSRSDTIPDMQIQNDNVTIAHEASAGKLNDDDVFYLMSRGLTEEQAKAMIVNGFIEPIVRELPLEYALELNTLMELEMEGSVG